MPRNVLEPDLVINQTCMVDGKFNPKKCNMNIKGASLSGEDHADLFFIEDGKSDNVPEHQCDFGQSVGNARRIFLEAELTATDIPNEFTTCRECFLQWAEVAQIKTDSQDFRVSDMNNWGRNLLDDSSYSDPLVETHEEFVANSTTKTIKQNKKRQKALFQALGIVK